MSPAVLPPLYSSAAEDECFLPAGKCLMVGYPCIPYSAAFLLCTVASNAPNLTYTRQYVSSLRITFFSRNVLYLLFLSTETQHRPSEAPSSCNDHTTERRTQPTTFHRNSAPKSRNYRQLARSLRPMKPSRKFVNKYLRTHVEQWRSQEFFAPETKRIASHIHFPTSFSFFFFF